MQQTRSVQPPQTLAEMLLTVQVQGLRHASSQAHRTARSIWQQACLAGLLCAAAAIASPAQTITTFSAAGAGTARGQGTTAVGINTAGEIAGYYENASSVRYGFERAADGKITSFQADASTT